MDENANPVGAEGAEVSSLTSWLELLEMLPTLSSAIHFTVVVPSAVTSKPALAPGTSVPFVTLSLPSIAGALPSVV